MNHSLGGRLHHQGSHCFPFSYLDDATVSVLSSGIRTWWHLIFEQYFMATEVKELINNKRMFGMFDWATNELSSSQIAQAWLWLVQLDVFKLQLGLNL